MIYSCLYCLWDFASTYALKRYISDKHQYDVSENDDKVTFQSDMSYKKTDLWENYHIMKKLTSGMMIL